MQVCSFISHQPKDFPWEYENNAKAHAEYLKELRQAVAVAVDLDKITTFYCGMEHCADLDFAEAVIYQRENTYPKIKLVCIVRSQRQCKDWNKKDINRYNSILERANKKQYVANVSLNQYLIDNSEQIIFVWDEKQSGKIWNNIQYAIQQERLTYFIRLNDIKADTDEPDGKLKRELKEAEQALSRSFYTRIGYTFLIDELIKLHPNPKLAFQTAIQNHPAFKREITNLAYLVQIDLSDNK